MYRFNSAPDGAEWRASLPGRESHPMDMRPCGSLIQLGCYEEKTMPLQGFEPQPSSS
jgi:hypothetical protein